MGSGPGVLKIVLQEQKWINVECATVSLSLLHLLACGADGAVFAEYRQADRTNVANVDELAMAEAGGTIVDLRRRGQHQLVAHLWWWQKYP